MKASKFLQIICLALPLLAAGCTDTIFSDTSGRVVEGLPAQLDLRFEVETSPVMTRAEQSASYENRVENLYVFIFDEHGTVHKRKFCTDGNGLSWDTNSDYSTGTVKITTTSVNNVTIVGIANLLTSTTATAYNVDEAKLNAVTSLDELKALTMSLSSNTVFRGGVFMMTGYAKDENGNTTINIPSGENVSPTGCTLQLERTDAKVKFIVKAENPHPGPSSDPDEIVWTNFTFQPKEWRVLQVPLQTYLLEAEAGDYDEDNASYFSTEYRVFENIDTQNYGEGSFVFYMPENKKTPKKQITESTITDEDKKAAYALREKQEKIKVTSSNKPGQTEENGAFYYANDNSTYVEITGTLSYTDSKNFNINADLKLMIHLGYAVPNPNPKGIEADVNDYNTLRNGFYTYNVTIKGIDNIIVEVTNDEDENNPEPRPGYEGSVSYSENKVFELDAHYDRCLLQFPTTNITDDLTWGIDTPFGTGVYQGQTSLPDELKDYKWVKFAINRDYGVTEQDKYVKYPGDLNYKGGDNKPSPYYNNGDGGTYPDARLLDVVQLIERLKQEKEEGTLSNLANSDNTITITAFIDEYLYFKHPQTGTENLLLWKECVGKSDRLLHIIPSELLYSPDGNSSIVNTIFTFKQKAIRTVYNVDNASLETAWGLESVMEGDRLPIAKNMPSTASNRDNGRLNTWEYFKSRGGGGNLKWTDVMNVTGESYVLNGGFQNVFYAILLRNRDLDGDNIVDENEIRWYLASINQLTDIYLGEYALDQNARLYPWNPAEGDYPPNGKSDAANYYNVCWHYASSTLQGGTENSNNTYPFVVWAEEGAGIGNYAISTNDNRNGSKYAYRCVRNLGIKLNDMNSVPEDLVIYDKDDRTFDLSRMNPKALRTYYVPGAGTYPMHTEKDLDNLPYKKFQVSTNRLGNNYNWTYYQTYNPFTEYRIPNMREMLIFTSRMNLTESSTVHIMSYTAFSMKGHAYYKYIDGNDTRYGYSFNLWDQSMGPGNNTGFVYGVRDIDN